MSLRLTMFPLRNFDLGTETERARLTSETGRLTAPDNEQRGFLSLESDFRIKEIKETGAVPATRRETADILSELKRQRMMRHRIWHCSRVAETQSKGRDKWRNLT